MTHFMRLLKWWCAWANSNKKVFEKWKCCHECFCQMGLNLPNSCFLKPDYIIKLFDDNIDKKAVYFLMRSSRRAFYWIFWSYKALCCSRHQNIKYGQMAIFVNWTDKMSLNLYTQQSKNRSIFFKMCFKDAQTKQHFGWNFRNLTLSSTANIKLVPISK